MCFYVGLKWCGSTLKASWELWVQKQQIKRGLRQKLTPSFLLLLSLRLYTIQWRPVECPNYLCIFLLFDMIFCIFIFHSMMYKICMFCFCWTTVWQIRQIVRLWLTSIAHPRCRVWPLPSNLHSYSTYCLYSYSTYSTAQNTHINLVLEAQESVNCHHIKSRVAVVLKTIQTDFIGIKPVTLVFWQNLQQ